MGSGMSIRYEARLRAAGKCVHLCFGQGNPPAGLHCERKVVAGTDRCKIHQPGYVRPGKTAPLFERLMEARAKLTETREALARVVSAWERCDTGPSIILSSAIFGAKRVLRGEPFDEVGP